MLPWLSLGDADQKRETRKSFKILLYLQFHRKNSASYAGPPRGDSGFSPEVKGENELCATSLLWFLEEGTGVTR